LAAVVVGLLFDYQQSYNDTFIFAGLTMMSSGIIVLLPWIQRRILSRNCASSSSFASVT